MLTKDDFITKTLEQIRWKKAHDSVRKELSDHIEGFSGVNSAYGYKNIDTRKHDAFTKAITWAVKAKAGTQFTINVSGVKAGQTSASIILE